MTTIDDARPDLVALMTELLQEVASALQGIEPHHNYSLSRVVYHSLVKIGIDPDVGPVTTQAYRLSLALCDAATAMSSGHNGDNGAVGITDKNGRYSEVWLMHPDDRRPNDGDGSGDEFITIGPA